MDFENFSHEHNTYNSQLDKFYFYLRSQETHHVFHCLLQEAGIQENYKSRVEFNTTVEPIKVCDTVLQGLFV